MSGGRRSPLRDEVIRAVLALQIEKGLDYESFLLGLHVALSYPSTALAMRSPRSRPRQQRRDRYEWEVSFLLPLCRWGLGEVW